MKISAKTKDCRLTVKVKTSFNETVDEKELDRFARVFLRCFLKPKLLKKNTIEYSGPIGITLQDRMKKEVTKRDFLFILEHIVVAVQKLQANNFPLSNLKTSMQYIYINETTRELQFLYVPVGVPAENANIIDLFNTVIYSAHPAQENDTEYISRFHYFFNGLKPFDIEKIEQFVYREDRSVVNTIKKHNAGQSGFMTSNHKSYYDHMDAQKKQQEEAERQINTPDEPSGSVVDEDATALLTKDTEAATARVIYAETASPRAGFGDTAWPGNGFDPSPEPSADFEDATGLLTDFKETAGFGETASPGAGFGDTAWPGAGFGDTAWPGNGFGAPLEPSADFEEATGLLTVAENSTISFPDEEKTGLLCAEDDVTDLWVEDDIEGTALLDETVQPKQAVAFPELHRTLTGEVIKINKPVFRIGKERSYVDYFVTNNNAISRSHADIITRESGYFVIDLNSKNRTYINNVALAVQEETRICNGDTLRLANEEFVFCVGSAAATLPVCPNCKAPIKQAACFCSFCGCKL